MSVEHQDMLGIARHEREALGRTIQYTPPDSWEAQSPTEGWRIRDVVAQLAAAEVAAAAVLVAEEPAELEEFLKSDEGRLDPTVNGFNRFAVARRADAPVFQVIREWGS